ncbi:MAG: pantetheine-phosphate adenylyltransferase [Nitratireductor sp.]|nr:pantetheine-phosphate adenylyltransferase [Nitratireductor sp.]
MKRIALYTGSFDPFTNGHLDVLRQGLGIADEVIVAIGIHPGKAPMFSFEERKDLVYACVDAACGEDSKRVKVVAFDNLAVEAARGQNTSFMLRGLRNTTDFDYEMQMAGMNGEMAPEVGTVFVPASPGTGHITGTLVRQIAKMGGDVSAFVPPAVENALKEKLGG